MSYAKYDIIFCKSCFYLLICNELFCIDQGNQLITITILQQSNFNVFLHDYSQCSVESFFFPKKIVTLKINHAKVQ